MSEPLIVMTLKLRARKRATPTETGVAAAGDVVLRWYPVCERFVWFDREGPISKAQAVKLLEQHDKIA